MKLQFFLQETAPRAISEHVLSENEIISLRIEGYFVITYYCRKKYKGGATAVCVYATT
jgi:hypothetical protein